MASGLPPKRNSPIFNNNDMERTNEDVIKSNNHVIKSMKAQAIQYELHISSLTTQITMLVQLVKEILKTTVGTDDKLNSICSEIGHIDETVSNLPQK